MLVGSIYDIISRHHGKEEVWYFYILHPTHSHVIFTKVDRLTIDLTDSSIQPLCERPRYDDVISRKVGLKH